MHKPIMRKKQFVSLYSQGVFGNHSPTWDTLDEYQRSCWSGLVHLRNRIAGGATHYNLKYIAACALWKRQANPNNWYCSAMAPTEKTIFQGEVMRGIWGLEITYTTIALPMREALRQETKTARGIVASSLLKHFLDVRSQDWLEVLLDRYSEHVIEFSTYSECWGKIEGYNTVFWEVRKY